MATRIAAGKKSPRTRLVLSAAKRNGSPASSQTIDIRVGAVTVQVPKPSRDEIRKNIRAGQLALERVQDKLTQPGVTLKMPANVPLYHADPKNPDLLIRILGKTRTSGRFIDGRFRAVANARVAKKAA